MEVRIEDLIETAGYSSDDYQRVLSMLKMSEKYKDKVRTSTSIGDVVEGDISDLIIDLIELESENEKLKKKEEEDKVAEEKKKKEVAEHKRKQSIANQGGCLYSFSGVRGRSIKVYGDRVVLHVEVTAGSVLTGNISDGTKVIFFKDVIGIQYRESKGLIGYLQFETASGLMNNTSNNMFNENTFTYDKAIMNNPTNETMQEVIQFVIGQIAKYKQQPSQYEAFSKADEIRKYKELLDLGAITQDEYEVKKKQLLNE